jgi:hypothetical protein
MPERQPFPPLPESTAICPECSASVPIMGGRWLVAHRAGSAQYPYPQAVRERCPGSLLVVPAPTPQP